MKLKKLKGNTYYIEGSVNIGVYVENNNVTIIDSGNGKDNAKKILKIIEENGWNLIRIINTHSHADHIGGNKFLKSKTNCEIISPNLESEFIENTILEPSFLWGANPFEEIRNKFLEADSTNVSKVINSGIIQDTNIEAIQLKGHCINMFGYKTKDNVVFIADSVFGKNILEKYKTFYLYDVEEYINTLDKLKNIKVDSYVPSHSNPTNNIDDLIDINKNKIEDISNLILKIIVNPKTFENILKEVSDFYNIKLNSTQYVLQGSTIKAYLTYLYKKEEVICYFENNKMLWTIQN